MASDADRPRVFSVQVTRDTVVNVRRSFVRRPGPGHCAKLSVGARFLTSPASFIDDAWVKTGVVLTVHTTIVDQVGANERC